MISSRIRSRIALATIACLGGVSASCAKQPPTAATLKPTTDAPARHANVTSAAAPKPVLAASKFPVIVHVVSRDKTVTISSGPKGPLYSLALNDGGKVIVADASGEEFERLQPEIYHSLRRYTAVKNNDTFMFDGVETSEKKLDPELIGVDLATVARD